MTANSLALASTQYGAPISEYRGSVSRIVFGIFGALMLIFGILVVIPSPSSSTGDSSGTVFAAIVFIAMALGFFWIPFSWRGARAQLFEQGFIISRAGKTTTARWDDITGVTQQITRIRTYGIPVWTTYLYKISLANGEAARVNNAFGKIGQLGDTIQRMSANALLPRAIASYQSGASLPFGKISISRAGISNGKETVPWSNIKQLTLQNGALIIRRNDKRLAWVSTPVAKTPNIYVLTALVDHIQRGAL
ncbi:MAG: DUF6585 family protein [Ktedonobacterales bacterium]